MSAHTLVRATFGPQARAELLYTLAAVPLAVVGCCYVLATLLLGVGLAVTAVGVPLVALGLYGARGLGRLHRGLANRLLGEHVEAPPPVRPASGLYGRVQALLSDVAAWRAMAYLVLQIPMALMQVYAVIVTYAWGLVLLTYPIQRALGLNQVTTRDRYGETRHGLVIHGFYFDTLPRELLVSLVGVLLLILAPRALQATVWPIRVMTEWLLGPHRPAERIRALERTRAQAVDDAAATLRRIERDLHDGAQASLVALTMQLTLVKEATPEGPARLLAERAQTTAREALAELRELVRGIHPPVLDQGLDAALASLAARSPVPVDLHVALTGRPTAAIESIAYFCAAELLTNVAKHSDASRAWLDLTGEHSRLRLQVADNGHGGATPDTGSGLPGLHHRVRTVDGHLHIDSPPGGPTLITIDLPYHA
ncbi:MAG TPA: sensor domain-containing protein [Thermomonospora sp.]|nr:sensor domain-containing protein [Thermomonospora sp.]